MVTRGFLVTVIAKPGKASDVAAFLSDALSLAEQETGTTAWFAIKIDDNTFGIFDVFPDEEARQVHIGGPIAAALMAKSDELLAEPPTIQPIDILAAKLPV